MEDFTEIFLLVVMAAIIIAAIKINYQNHQQRKLKWFCKTIYNYAGKSQQQIYEILSLELRELNLTGYEIDHFSKPLFKKDASAEYIVYLKPLTPEGE